MAPLKSVLSTSKKTVDPSLDALFSSSAKPVAPSKKPKYSQLVTPKPRAPYTPNPVRELDEDEKNAKADESDESDEDDEEGEDGDDSDELREDEDGGEGEPSNTEKREERKPAPQAQKAAGNRKRKTRDDAEDLESKYLDKISRETAPSEKRLRRTDGGIEPVDSTLGQEKGEEDEDPKVDEDEGDLDEPLIHESLLGQDSSAKEGEASDVKTAGTDREKAVRTVFLSNVSVEAVTSRAAKKTLLTHLVSMPSDPPAVVESLRFRSVPFSSSSLPKRAAFITKAVMGATAQAANAYVVYTTAAGARLAARELNGSVVLGRHLRADSVAHPSPIDHRRCVFVGNLGFMDDEVVEAEGEEGNTKKRFKVPMDVEEGLWRVFGKHAGRVESVRVVRDPITRVGKGFAYVQFVDGTSVEAALLLADRKFPPLLPRTLRVSRCFAPQKTATAIAKTERAASAREEARKRTKYVPKLTAEQQTEAGRAAKLLGRAAAWKDKKTPQAARAAGKPPGQSGAPLIFEGMRARAGQGGLPGKKGRGDRSSKGKQGKRAHQTSKWKGKK